MALRGRTYVMAAALFGSFWFGSAANGEPARRRNVDLTKSTNLITLRDSVRGAVVLPGALGNKRDLQLKVGQTVDVRLPKIPEGQRWSLRASGWMRITAQAPQPDCTVVTCKVVSQPDLYAPMQFPGVAGARYSMRGRDGFRIVDGPNKPHKMSGQVTFEARENVGPDPNAHPYLRGIPAMGPSYAAPTYTLYTTVTRD